MDPIDPGQSELEDALMRAGRNVSMSPELRNKTLAALGVGVAVGVTTTSVAKAGTLGWLSGKTGAVVAATGLVGALGVAGAVALSGGLSPAPPAAGSGEGERRSNAAATAEAVVDTVDAPSDTESSAVPELADDRVADSAVEREVEQKASAAERPKQRSAPAHRESSSAEPSGLREELSHIARVESALKGGNPARALALLTEYRRRFPRPRLGLEAEVLTIQALSENGSASAARKRAQRFLDKYPTSPLGARAKRYLE